MKIAYDGMPFTYNWIEGMHVYNNRLLEKLSLLYPENTYSFYFYSLRNKFEDVKLPVPPERSNRVIMPFPSTPFNNLELRMIFDFMIPRSIRKEKPDIFHALRYHVPKTRKAKVVTTYHDLAAYAIPHLLKQEVLSSRSNWYTRGAERSDMLIANSNNTRDELINFLKVPEEKITVTHLAASEIFRPITDKAELERVRAKYDLPSIFLFGLCSEHSRKSPERVLRALAQIPPQKIDHAHFVLFGSRQVGVDRYMPLIKELHLQDRVRFLPIIPNEDLVPLYSLCRAFVFPSLYEGFGIPILEAMACGAPVITGNVSAMPEVGGSAPYYVDPKNVEEIAVAIERVLTDSALRDKMIKTGLERSKEFSWEKTARETMAVYQKLV